MKAAKTKPSGVLKYSSLIALQRGTVQGVTPGPPGKKGKVGEFLHHVVIRKKKKKKKQRKKTPPPSAEPTTAA